MKREMNRREKCGICYFWEAPDIAAAFNGVCCRYPQRVPKHCEEFCGEFKEKKIVEVLREEKKE